MKTEEKMNTSKITNNKCNKLDLMYIINSRKDINKNKTMPTESCRGLRQIGANLNAKADS